MQALRPLQLSKQFRCSATRWYVLPVSYSYAGRACATSAIWQSPDNLRSG